MRIPFDSRYAVSRFVAFRMDGYIDTEISLRRGSPSSWRTDPARACGKGDEGKPPRRMWNNGRLATGG